MEFPEPYLITVEDPAIGEINLSVHEAGDGPAVLLCHGFPDLGYSWRHQFPALVEGGFRAIAPDQRGYGSSSAPQAIESYGLSSLTADLAQLLDTLDIETAVVVGHDWGGFVAWAFALLYPERCTAVASVCTPYTPFPPTGFLRALVEGDDDRHYMLWFQKLDEPERFLDPRARLVFEKLMRGGVPMERVAEMMTINGGFDMNPFKRIDDLDSAGEVILDSSELDHYAEIFSRTGFRSAINWYRNLDANAAQFPEVGVQTLDIPALMICAELDPALPPALAESMGERCSDLEMHIIPGAGHWVQHEKPYEVNALLVDWLTRRFLSS